MYDSVQDQRHGVPKVTKMTDFKVCLLCQYTRNSKGLWMFRPFVSLPPGRCTPRRFAHWYISK